MKTNPRPTNALAATRLRLGLNQEQMGLHLGVSKSMVKLVETNRKSLPHERLLKLAALEIELAVIPTTNGKGYTTSVQEVYDKEESNYELETRYQEGRCRHQAMKLEKRLKKMEVDHKLTIATLQNLDTMAKLELNNNDPFLRSLKQVRPKMMKKLSQCNIHKQAKLKTKIALLRAEAGLNKSIHPEYVHTNEKPIISPLKKSKMDYTVSTISSRADCQLMIDNANSDKDTLAYKKTGLERQMQSASSNSVGIDADLASVTAELDALQTILDTLPEGSVKEETRVKQTKAEYKKFLLEQRKANYGSTALVGKEYDIACVEKSIAETDALILAITTRMNELPVTP